MPEAAAILARVAGNDLDDRVEATTLVLRAAAIERGMVVTGDDRISECDAAALLELEAESLAKRRQEGRAPVSYKVPIGTARISYRLADLGRWVEAQRDF